MLSHSNYRKRLHSSLVRHTFNYEKRPTANTSLVLILHDDRQPQLHQFCDCEKFLVVLGFQKEVSFSFAEMEYSKICLHFLFFLLLCRHMFY